MSSEENFGSFDLVFSVTECDHATGTIVKRDVELSDVIYRFIHNRKVPVTACQRFLAALLDCFRCCGIYCCPPCLPCIIQKIAFRPPKPTYRFIPFGPPRHGDYRISTQKLFVSDYYACTCPWEMERHLLVRGYYVGNKKRARIACVYCRGSWLDVTSSQITLLLSHSNAGDLGVMLPQILQLSRKLKADVFAYDYSGYGCSGGSCSEKKMYKNVEQVYKFMVKSMKIPWTRIVAIGTSLGTAATIHLASKHRVCGVVLQGSFASALRVFCPDQEKTSCMDRFVNVDKIHQVRCPTLFVHGLHDELFDVEHMEQLRRRCPGAAIVKPLIIKRGGHIDFENHKTYWKGMRRFLSDLVEARDTMMPRVKSTKKPRSSRSGVKQSNL